MHTSLPEWLDQLDAALDLLPAPADPMTLSQVDGFLAGILVCPEVVPPSEWLPMIWNTEGADEAVFRDMDELQAVIDLVMKLHNGINEDLARPGDHYQPVYDVLEGADEVIPDLWITGFSYALMLRPESWEAIDDSGDEDATTALATLTALVALIAAESSLAGEPGVLDEAGLPEEAFADLQENAPDLIPLCVKTLYAWRRKNAPATVTSGQPKIGLH